MDSRTFREQLQRPKHLELKSYLYHWKAIEMEMCKMGSHDPFGHLQHKLWYKKRSGVKIGNLTLEHKKSRIDLTSMRAGGMQHAIGKLSTRATTLL